MKPSRANSCGISHPRDDAYREKTYSTIDTAIPTVSRTANVEMNLYAGTPRCVQILADGGPYITTSCD